MESPQGVVEVRGDDGTEKKGRVLCNQLASVVIESVIKRARPPQGECQERGQEEQCNKQKHAGENESVDVMDGNRRASRQIAKTISKDGKAVQIDPWAAEIPCENCQGS